MKVFKGLLSIFFVVALAACGGRSSSEEGDETPVMAEEEVVQTGRFIDGPVSGLYYETDTQKGTTSGDGEFSYILGENIVFYIGGFKLPPIAAIPVITPLDYVPEASGANNLHVVNLIRLLQSLDVDLDHNNGVQLPLVLGENIDTNAAEALIFNIEINQFENSGQVEQLLIANNATSLIDESIAILAFQNVIDQLLADVLAQAENDSVSQVGVGCADDGNIVSPYPCIPGTGGFELGDLSIKTFLSVGAGIPSPGGRNDFIWADNNYHGNVHSLSDIYDDTYIVNDFARDLEVGIINFVTTDRNPDSHPIFGDGSWNYTELNFDGGYVGSLPYAQQEDVSEVRDRCGLPNDTRQIIVPPGIYQYDAKAYKDFWCLRLGLHCSDESIEDVQNPVWSWTGQVEVSAGECVVVNAFGNVVDNSSPETPGDWKLEISFEFSQYTSFEVEVRTPSGSLLSTEDDREVTPKIDGCYLNYDYSIEYPTVDLLCDETLQSGTYLFTVLNPYGETGSYTIEAKQNNNVPIYFSGDDESGIGESYSYDVVD